MRGPKPGSPRPLTGPEAKEREQLVRAHPTPQSRAQHARIILLARTHPMGWCRRVLPGVQSSTSLCNKYTLPPRACMLDLPNRSSRPVCVSRLGVLIGACSYGHCPARLLSDSRRAIVGRHVVEDGYLCR
jgi:hypothetical protein